MPEIEWTIVPDGDSARNVIYGQGASPFGDAWFTFAPDEDEHIIRGRE